MMKGEKRYKTFTHLENSPIIVTICGGFKSLSMISILKKDLMNRHRIFLWIQLLDPLS